jgi:hypothetical protein
MAKSSPRAHKSALAGGAGKATSHSRAAPLYAAEERDGATGIVVSDIDIASDFWILEWY